MSFGAYFPKQIANFKKDQYHIAWLLALLGSFLVRLALLPGSSGDLDNFLVPWSNYIRTHGGIWAYKDKFSDYAPLYTYFLGFATLLGTYIGQVAAIKFLSVVFDYVIAYFVYRWVGLSTSIQWRAQCAALIALFLPTVLVNSAFWGQSDSIYAAFILGALYYLVIGRTTAAMILYGIGFATKFQAVFISPVFLMAVFAKRISVRQLFWVPAIYVLTCLPAALVGRPWVSLLSVYLEQTSTYSQLSLNCPNLYRWIPDTFFGPVRAAGLVFTTFFSLCFAIIFSQDKKIFIPRHFVSVALLCAWTVPYILPQMHERYMYVADVLSIVYFYFYTQRVWVPVAINLISLFAYMPFLFGKEPISLDWVALAWTISLLMLARSIWQDVALRGVRVESRSTPKPSRSRSCLRIAP